MKLKLISIDYYKFVRAFYLRRANKMLSSSPKYPNYLAPYPLFALFLLFFVVLLDDVVVVVVVVADVVVPISFPTSATISLSIAS